MPGGRHHPQSAVRCVRAGGCHNVCGKANWRNTGCYRGHGRSEIRAAIVACVQVFLHRNLGEVGNKHIGPMPGFLRTDPQYSSAGADLGEILAREPAGIANPQRG